MEWTPAKLRYLLTFHTLSGEKETAVRCIDMAVQLGVSRASASRMLAQFVDEGILAPSGRSGYQLTDNGKVEAEHYFSQYQSLCQLFGDRLKLSDYDSRECAVTLITALPYAMAEDLQRKCQQYLSETLPPQE